MELFDIEKFLDLQNYEESRNDRRKGSGGTAEYFTPYSIVKRMCDKVSDEDWSDPDNTFLEPSFGSGQFIIYMIYNRLQHGIDWRTALSTMWGVELMEDNVAECKQRVCDMLTQLCDDFNEDEARVIMDNNFVCSDFFKWNFEEWRPMTDEEIKKAKNK